MSMQALYKELEQEINENNLGKEEIHRLKNQLCKKHGVSTPPTDIQIALNTNIKVLTKPVRSISGVAPIAVMSRPGACPHGRCTYCPGGIGSVFGDVPQSYTGKEPSTMRAIRNNYDPYLIVMNRLEHFVVMNHIPEKTELIVQGGTFLFFPKIYKERFITHCLKAMNDFSDLFYEDGILNVVKFKEFFELPGEVTDEERTKRIHEKLLELRDEDLTSNGSDLEKEKLRNENAQIRCVAMVIETKPDMCKEEHIDEMLRYGVTRVEVGVQTLKDEVLSLVHRGHDLNDTKECTQLMKDSLLKVTYHMMPGLPETTKEEDLNFFKELFENEAYQPDALKIYPCMVMPGTKLFEDMLAGKFTPLSTEEAAELIAKAMAFVPEYCRIMRVQRDIPSYQVAEGVKKTNLRQYVDDFRKKYGIECKDIRAREPKGLITELKDIEYKIIRYDASGGKEIFISAEANDKLIGFCRLRIVNKPHRGEFKGKCAGIRELHVYTQAIGVGAQNERSMQHKGIGKKLLQMAEDLAKEEFGCEKMLIISGIGVREYYKKFDYALEGPYMVKNLS